MKKIYLFGAILLLFVFQVSFSLYPTTTAVGNGGDYEFGHGMNPLCG